MKSELFKYKILFSTILIIFAAILIFLFHYTAQSGNTEIEKLVLEQARTSFNKDLLYRKWASMQGGVYVPITDSVKPNPYLEVEDREITSTKGKEYTLINPAYMTRQVHAIGNKYYKIKGHITSLDPINPVNAPDKWEQQALNKFKEGFSEFYSKETIGDELYLRYMGAMKVENSCLHCHEKQGYKPGDVRGGISVSVPFKNFEAIRDADKYSHLIIFIGIFIFFILCLYTAYHILIRELKNRLINEQQKLENAERHKKIIRSAINGFIITDIQGNILEVNPSYSKMTGYTEKELIGMNLSQIEKSEDNSTFNESIKKNIRKEAFRYESIHKKKDGSFINLELSESIQPNDGGQFIFFVEDITERRIAEQELIKAKELAEENAEKFHFIAENIQDVIWVFDAEEAKFTYISPSVEKMQGFTTEEFLNAPFQLIMPQKSAQQMMVMLQERLEKFKITRQKEGYIDEIKLLHKNGKEIWVEIVSFYQINPKSGRIESIGTTRNINQRKNTELALQESEQQYRLLFENMNEAFALHKIITDEEGIPVDYEFIDINSKFEQLTGLKKENIIGKSVLEIMPNTEKYWIDRYGKVALDNEPQEFSDYSGELDKYYQVKVYSPQYQYFAVTFSDITFQQKAEKILQQSEEKFKNRFAYFPFPTFIWQRKDDDFVMISANKAAYDQSNGEIENIFGIKSRILWKNEPELSDYLDNCFNSKSNFTIERYYYFRGSKKNQYVSTTYSFLPPDNVQIITMDITDRKLAEQEIRNQKKLFETMFNTISDGMVITDTSRKILMANNGMKSTFGYEPESLIGKTTELLYPDIKKFSFTGEKVFNEAAPGSENFYITNYKDAEGNIFPGETFGTKLFDNSGVWIGNLGIMRNISERQKMISDLLEAKEKAEESENKYRNLVETAQELIWKCDNRGKFTYLNHAWELTHGYKLEEMIGKGFNAFQSEEVFQRDNTEFSKTLANGAIKNYETTHISKDGRELTLLFNAIPVFDTEGNIIGSQGTATDITDRKNYEKELEDHRNNLEKLVQERTDELKAASEELRSNLIELIEIRESLLKSEDVLNEVQSLGAIGGWRYDVSSNEAWWTKGLFELHDLPFDRHSNDIRKKIEQSLICYPEQDRELVIDSFNKAVNKGIPYTLEHLFTTHRGRRIWVKNVGKPVSENGKIVRVIGALIDITEQKNAEMLLQSAKAMIESSNEELKASNVELYQQKEALEETLKKLHEAQAQLIQSEKMASLGILVAGVAHEINNPVNFISASLSGLKNNLDYLSSYTSLYNQIDKNTREVIKKIKEKEKEASFGEVLEMFKRSIDIIEVGIERTTKIVKGLRSFARSDETKLDKYNVHENIENTLLILFNQYKNRIEIVQEFGEIPPIECYPGQINQVIMNILVNAIQSIENEGKISISTGMLDDKKIFIIIEDSGEGISQDKIKKIFDPFYTTKEVGTGTGLGLSISYGIIQAHKGQILVESFVGKGSLFTIHLPINQENHK